jgi:3'5'-cyclic nucleotide phosphodiesterase
LISRIVSPLEILARQNGSERRLLASKLYDHTFGLTSDPLTLFACAFSALIHDVDHPGVPNSVLIQENGELAKLYKNKSVGEQNSVDLAWTLLMSDKYTDLRAAIFVTKSEQDHFRQVVVNCVMATDLMDPDLKESRNQRWRRAFNESPARHSLARANDNRKASIVIEHLIQASDIAHTMQHVSLISHPLETCPYVCS